MHWTITNSMCGTDYNYWTTGTGGWNYTGHNPLKSPQQRLKELLKSRQFPGIVTQTRPVGHAADIREIRARETLRRFIGEDKYKKFLRTGWVNVRARSGLVYQIYPSHGITNVYDKGKKVDRLCVVLTGGFPPTDSLIIRYILILNNEQLFRSKAVRHQVQVTHLTRQVIKIEPRPLVEMAREIRAKVG